MQQGKSRLLATSSGFLARLASNRSGHTLGIMAAMLVPMTALAGSTVDTARLYLVKVRLQQACDAGVLAARKSEANPSDTNLDSGALTQANAFFTNNFKTGYLQTSSVTFTPTKVNTARVSGTASANVPMALMQIFGQPTQTVNVTCEARYDIGDTDIVFVLDNTGSMSCLPSDDDATCNTYVGSAGTTAYTRPSDGAAMNTSVPGYPGSGGYYVPEKSGSRISALRTAVVNFYQTLAAAVTDPGVHIRYGFVTYTSIVNAGGAIMSVNPAYMVGGSGSGSTNWTYQSRKVIADYTISSTLAHTYYGLTSSACAAYGTPRSPATALTYNSSTGQATQTVTNYSGGVCTVYNNVYGPQWQYQPVSFNVTNFLTQSSVPDPSRVDGGTASWQGCIEERDTTAGTTTFNTSSLPPDLDPDLIPSSDSTRWRPAWPEVVYGRNYNGSSTVYGSSAYTTSNGDTSNITTALGYTRYGNGTLLQYGWYSCGKPIRRLSVMSQSDVSAYVNAADFKAIGGTYHDTGMIWGTRLLSPNGIFASDTAAWPGDPTPNRVIVFLTDGVMAPAMSIYGQYGEEYFDKRVTGGDYSNQTNYHNARFLAECAKAKSMNISIWTVTIGSTISTPLQQCASNTNQALNTTSGSDLSAKFATIAQNVAHLRISQ